VERGGSRRLSASARAVALTERAARAASAVKARDIVALDVSRHLPFADVFVIASGSSERQVLAIAERVEEELAKGGKRSGARALRKEGAREGRWVLLDFNDIIVHVLHDDEREYYALERLWKDCPVVPLPEDL
jgi:ribosome-associated protein